MDDYPMTPERCIIECETPKHCAAFNRCAVLVRNAQTSKTLARKVAQEAKENSNGWRHPDD